MDRRSIDGRFFVGISILAINCWKESSKFRDAGREDCVCSEQDHPEFPIQEEGQSRGTERRTAKNQVTTCSEFPWDAMLRIKDVEMVDSLDELKTSRSVQRKDFPNSEMLDHEHDAR